MTARGPVCIRSSRAIVAWLACLLAAGCSVDPKREVALYREVLDREGLQSDASQSGGECLTLAQALRLASENNEALAARGEEYVRALIEKSRATASFLPTVSLQPSYSFTGDFTPGTVRTSDSSSHFQLPLIGSLNVFNGGADLALVRAAEARIAERKALLLDMQATVLLNVAQVYYQVLRSERQVEVLEHSYALQEARLREIQARFRNGLATTLDVAQSQARVEQTAVTSTRARNDVANGRAVLARLLGLGERVSAPLSADVTVPAEIDSDEVYEEQALLSRQDLLAAGAAVEAARKDVDVAFAQYYPSVSINAATFLAPDLFTAETHWNAVLIAHVPIFTGGVIHADVRAAWSRLRQAALDESAILHQVEEDVAVALNNLTANEQIVRGLLSQADAARRAHDLATRAYTNGLATNLDVVQAQEDLLQAELQLVSAELDRAVFYLDLLRSTGQLDLGGVKALAAR